MCHSTATLYILVGLVNTRDSQLGMHVPLLIGRQLKGVHKMSFCADLLLLMCVFVGWGEERSYQWLRTTGITKEYTKCNLY